MKKIFFLTTALVVGLFLAQVSYADNFIKYLRGIYSDVARDVHQTSDGGYIIGGSMGSVGMIIKLDVSGNISWQTAIGVNRSQVYSVQQTSDGEYIAAGKTDWDILLVKLDSDGNILWHKTIGSPATEIAYSIQETSDGGYILGGVTYPHALGTNYYYYSMLLIKTDSEGNILWQKAYGEGYGKGYGSVATSIQETSDGGYIVGGSGVGDYKVMKVDPEGNIIWGKAVEGNDYDYLRGRSVRQTSDGGYIIAGYSGANLIKLDASGNIIWQKKYSISIYLGPDATFAQETSDGGLVMIGNIQLAGGIYALLVKLDSSGNILWQKAIGKGDFGFGGIPGTGEQTSDGGYVIAGIARSISYDIIIMKLDAAGNIGECAPIQDINLNINDSSFEAKDAFFEAANLTLSSAVPSLFSVKSRLTPETVCFLAEEKNRSPIANAGDDQTIQLQSCSGSTVTLDGSGSSDPDGDLLTYTWTWDGGSADGVSPVITLPYGLTTVTLNVDDAKGGTSSDTVNINIVDTIAPSLNVTLNPNLIWPPNHKYVKISPSVSVDDACIATTKVELISAVSSEPDNGLGDGDTANDIVVNADGTISLRAERSGTGNGRVYTITYKATDLAGNVTVSSATAIVPHDMGKK